MLQDFFPMNEFDWLVRKSDKVFFNNCNLQMLEGPLVFSRITLRKVGQSELHKHSLLITVMVMIIIITISKFSNLIGHQQP